VRCDVILTQDTLQTIVTLRPVFGEFPDNALLVVRVTTGVRDFGGLPVTPHTFSFTTQNRPTQTGLRTFEFDGDVPVNENLTTAEVNTSRAASRAQGFLLFAGDGDNGANLTLATGPDSSRGPPGCTLAGVGIPQGNDGLPDDFLATAGDWVLDSGATRNTCLNSTDGSTAVIFEFRSFRVTAGATVRIVGVNPTILLVQGDVLIEAGGRVLVRGDNGGPVPRQGAGANGPIQTNSAIAAGGTGVAGGGAGGDALNQGTASDPPGGFFAQNGAGGFGSLTYGAAKVSGGTPPVANEGQGHGAIATNLMYGVNGQYLQPTRSSPGGGGGGHALPGSAGQNVGPDTGGRVLQQMGTNPGGEGGNVYGDQAVNPASGIVMQTPEAGSGGGGGGDAPGTPFQTSAFYHNVGGGGGAGGGFIDITSKNDILVLGTIDAAGSRGGSGGAGNAFYGGGGGGGGGSGGGIRILTPGMLICDTSTVITTIGGAGGSGAGVGPSAGGMGAVGRLAIETMDSLITKATPGAVPQFLPGEGQIGFSRFPFHGARFQGGGLQPVVVTETIDIGPFAPTFIVPDQNYTLPPVAAPAVPRLDFVAGVPSISSRGIGKAAIFIEAKGFVSNADGSVNIGSDSGWKSVGYFTDSGSEMFPAWVAGSKPPALDVPTLPPGNTGDGIASLNGRQYVQLRITFFLPSNFGPFDPGPYIDSWNLYFQYDQ
jgi:hypothetical protein